MVSTRERILAAALEQFGVDGYHKSSVAAIERAAGLSPGAGGIYRHFRSKEQLLVEAVRSRLTDWGPYAAFAEPDYSAASLIESAMPGASLTDKVAELCRIGLVRADHIRDVTRLLLRDSSAPADVLEAFRTDDHAVVAGLAERTLRDLAHESGADVDQTDWSPVAEVLVGAISHLWLVRDVYGGDAPWGTSSEQYISTTAAMVAALIDSLERTTA